MPPWSGVIGFWETYGVPPWEVFGVQGGRLLWFARSMTWMAGVDKGRELRATFERKGDR